MTTNPFEDEDGRYLVLVNEENQHSLWPAYLDVPAGWTTTLEGTRQECLDHVDATWTDLRPASLRTSQSGASQSGASQSSASQSSASQSRAT